MDRPDMPAWYELATGDMAAAERFYGAVLGWTAEPFGGDGPPYRVLHHKGGGFGGIMPLPDGMPGPVWTMYVAVADIDAAVTDAAGDGGVVRHRMDVAGVGRLAFLTDPYGADFALIQPAPQETAGDCPPEVEPACGWHELHASDGEAATGWYGRRFRWQEADALDMGPLGKYRLIAPEGAPPGDMAAMVGGAMTAMPQVPPHWELYFTVDDIDAAAARVAQAGGSILHGPMEVPGGAWVANATDPQGAAFSIVGAKA